jgi:hypothetical protein
MELRVSRNLFFPAMAAIVVFWLKNPAPRDPAGYFPLTTSLLPLSKA